MADIVEKVRIDGDSKGAEKAAKKTEQSLTGAFFKSQVAAQALNKSVEFLSQTIGDAIHNAAEYERTTLALDSALKLTKNDADGVAEALADQASAMQDVTGVSDEVIRKLQTQSVLMGVAVDETDDLIRASFGLANAMGKNVDEVFKALIKTTQGMVDETTGLIPEVKALTKAQLLNGDAVDIVNAQFGEFADAQRRGMGGALIDLKNAWDDLAESIALTFSKSSAADGFFSSITGGLQSAGVILSRLGDEGFTLADMFADPDRFGERLFATAQGVTEAVDEGEAVSDPAAELLKRSADARGRDKKVDVTAQRKLAEAHRKANAASAAALAEANDAFQADQRDQAEQRAAFILDLEQRVADGQADILQENFDRRVEITNEQFEFEKQQFTDYWAEKDRIAEEGRAREQAMQNAAFASASMATNQFVSSSLQALEVWADGGEFSAMEFAVGLLKGIGRSMIGQGISNSLQGLALTFTPGGQADGAALIGIGGTQVALGSAMFGGGLVLGGRGSGGGSGGTGSGGGGGAPVGRIGPGVQAPGGGGNSEGVQTVVVNFNGPTTRAEVGVAIQEALDEAKSQGLR